MSLQCAILAGGLGTRLGALAKARPKALLPIAGRAFVDYQLDWLAANDVGSVVFCIGHLGRQIVDHVGDGGRFGLAVRYVEDGERPRGTAGALRRALDAPADDYAERARALLAPFTPAAADAAVAALLPMLLQTRRRPGLRSA